MDYARLTAPCGLPCFTCYLFLAQDDPQMRHLVSRELGLPLEKAACPGCRALQGQPGHLPMACQLYPCAEVKGVQFCSDCDEFPCDKLHPYCDQAKMWHNTKVFQLCLIQKMGLTAWAEQKAKSVLETYSFGKFSL